MRPALTPPPRATAPRSSSTASAPRRDLTPRAVSPALPLGLGLALALLAPACGADDAAGYYGASDTASNWSDVYTPSDTSIPWNDTWTTSDTGPAADTLPPPPPPEEEVDFDLRTPEAGNTFLYIPSAALDALVVVDARTLEVHLVEVGIVPTIVRALPGDAGAIVLNEGSSDVSVVRPNPIVAGEPPAEPFSVETHDVLAGANRLVLSPDGAFAFAFFASTSSAATYGSLQDVSVLRLGAPALDGQLPDVEVINLAVGFRPSDVIFANGDRLALIVCENGLSGFYLEDLTGDAFLPPIPTSPDPFRKPNDREILVTPDGTAAVVRDLGTLDLVHVDLTDGAMRLLRLPDYASDLDMTADGQTIIVPMRARNEVALIAIPDAFLWTAPEPEPEPDPDPEPAADFAPTDTTPDPNPDATEPTDATPDATEPDAGPEPEPAPQNPHIRNAATGAAFGSTLLTSDQRHALLYSTSPGVMAIGMVDLETAGVVIQPTVKEIESVIAAPDAKMAAILHRTSSGSGDLGQRPAYSLLDLASGYSKLVVSAQPVSSVTFTRDASELFALLPDPLGAIHEVHRVKTRSFAVTTYRVPDRPVFVGAMPSIAKVAIALDNPTGWITFIDTETDELLQLNSFELNGFIE